MRTDCPPARSTRRRRVGSRVSIGSSNSGIGVQRSRRRNLRVSLRSASIRLHTVEQNALAAGRRRRAFDFSSYPTPGRVKTSAGTFEGNESVERPSYPASISVRHVQGTPARALHATDDRFSDGERGLRLAGHREIPGRRALPLGSRNRRWPFDRQSLIRLRCAGSPIRQPRSPRGREKCATAGALTSSAQFELDVQSLLAQSCQQWHPASRMNDQVDVVRHEHPSQTSKSRLVRASSIDSTSHWQTRSREKKGNRRW